MLDNMTPDQIAGCVELVRDPGSDILVEVSGGVTLETVPAFAATGVDLISVGALTHSAPILDLGFDLASDPDEERPLSMLLAIDVGNTETVVGLFVDDPAAATAPPGLATGTSRPAWPITGDCRRWPGERRTSTRCS